MMPEIDKLPIPESQRSIQISHDVQVQPGSALVNFTAGRYMLGVQPVLDFVSRSPDRCWVLFAPRSLRDGPDQKFTGMIRGNDSLDLAYRSDFESLLHISTDAQTTTSIESMSRLNADIYSHLNTYCELTITGHHRLFVIFSPCPQTPIEVTSMEYPSGKPERLAYLDASEMFRVVEGSSAEKGPYHELIHGKLSRSDALTMSLLDNQQLMFRLTFADWAAQASVALSPTAGFGLPENAIEFSLNGANPSSSAGIYMTLAATSAGRGYASVGHAAGVYRNRIIVENPNPK
ncbi:MAG TPA: hypothetical protein VHS31_03770 [Tepidisphaeraceae bacterium]|nr:hypothetical protein [Tepidisphaeraceae bacterium]